MSEPVGTEDTGFAMAQESTAPVPRQFTPEEPEEARQQLLAQGADLGQPPPVVDQASLGVQALAAGAEPAEVDADALLRMLKAQQAQIDRLLAEKRLATAPDVVKYATALADHLQARADQNPVIHADPDHTFMPVLGQAADLVNAANAAAESGDPSGLADQVDQVRRWITRHQRRFPALDYSYLLELADEADEAARKLAA